MVQEIDFRTDFYRRAEALQMTTEQYIRALGFSEGEFDELCGIAVEAFSGIVLSGDHDITLAKFRFGYEARKSSQAFAESGSFSKRQNGLEQGIDSALSLLYADRLGLIRESQIILPDAAFRQEMMQAFPDVISQKRGIVTLTTAMKEAGTTDIPTFAAAVATGIHNYWDKSPTQSVASMYYG